MSGAASVSVAGGADVQRRQQLDQIHAEPHPAKRVTPPTRALPRFGGFEAGGGLTPAGGSSRPCRASISLEALWWPSRVPPIPLGPSSSRESCRKVMVTMASVSKSEVACVFVFPLGHLYPCFSVLVGEAGVGLGLHWVFPVLLALALQIKGPR